MMNKREIIIGFCLLFFILTLVYANHFDNAFHFDDIHTITSNVFIRNLTNWKLFFQDATTFSSLPTNQSYRPISTLSIAIDYWLANGYNTFYYHLSTYIWFVIQLVLMYFLCLKIFSFASENIHTNRLISFIAITFYAFHPANAETINYIIARSDLFTAFFTIMALVVYSYFPEKRKYYFYLIPIVIGILAKPPTIMFLPILFIYLIIIYLLLMKITY
jgi:protein O-mannosyl-transferase